VCIWLSAVSAAAAQPEQAAANPTQVDGITRLVDAIQRATDAGDADAIRALARPSLRPAQLVDFVQSLTQPKVSHASVKERDRAVVDGRVRLMLEILTERDIEGRVTTWRVDVEPVSGDIDGPWGLTYLERLTMVGGLYRLSVDGGSEFEVRNLTVTQPDLSLVLPTGYAFQAQTPDGPTALVLIGKGHIEFTPKPEAERGQLRIFSGAEALKTDFDTVFLRLNPSEFHERIARDCLKPRASVDQGHLRRATQVLETYLPKSFQIDLNDLSTESWSLVPSGSDFVAEIVTGRYGPLTYARANAEPEDISFFDRRRHRNIAVYPSDAKLTTRGRFFSEDEKLEYDVKRYEIEVSFAPDRLWVDGTAKLTIHTRSAYLSTLTLRLADPLVVRSITSPQFGRLLHLRVVGQNNVLVGFPATIVGDTDVDLIVTYGGRLPPQSIDREAVTLQQDQIREDVVPIPSEPQYMYSNRSYWYPQAPVTEYATAKITATVPGELDAVASGTQQGPPTILPAAPGQRGRKKFVFETSQPTRYLAVLISRFVSTPPSTIRLQDDDDPLVPTVATNPREANRARAMSEKAADILKFYTSVLGDAPYSSFTLAVTESDLPGGHSPAYFAMLNQPLPTTPFVWSNDPVSFQNYPSFFIAHELAHQWWGQAVGWKNYHEQWLSEGFAQYFAALYAEHERGPDQFFSVLRQMRRWAIEMSPQGPVYLGYRLGHLKGEGKVFRALVYNKGAMVLHMLRRLMGDEAFNAGLRDFYATWRYKKAGTDDFRAAMEKAGGRPLDRFFDRWIFGSGIPSMRFTSRVEGTSLVTHFEQKGDVYDVPVTVTISYADGTTDNVVVAVTEKTIDRTIPLKGAVRGVDVNKDGGALVEIEK
jgi:hypothetical protein